MDRNSNKAPFDLLIAIDSEYVQKESENRVLCYSFACASPTKPHDALTDIFHLTGSQRWTRWPLGKLLSRIITVALDQKLIERPPTKRHRSKGKPERVKLFVGAHFSRADLPGFRDWRMLKRRFDAVRGTYATTRQPKIMTLYPQGRARLEVSLTLVDTLLLAPHRYHSLRALGESLGFEKLEVGEYITKMDQLRDSDLKRFEAYAIRDSEVCLKWIFEFLEFWENDLGFIATRPPSTIASAAMRYAFKLWKSDGVDVGDVCGYRGRGKDRHWIDLLRQHIPFLADCYHGGRNEAFWVGPTSAPGDIYDLDLVSAYTTAMSAIRMPHWEACFSTQDLQRLAVVDSHMAFARIKFQFPPETKYPCLPVRTRDNGLIYPLEGVTHVCGPELVVALAMGARIEVVSGLVIPWQSDYRPFLRFTQKIRELRRKHPKGSPRELLAKEIGNSLYGKTGQGVQNLRPSGDGGIDDNPRQRVFNSRAGRMEDLPPSRITAPALAAFTTSVVRAVLSEMLAALPDRCTVYTATTDGFLSTVNLTDVRQDGPLCRLFQALRERIEGPGTPILEIKHCIRNGIVMKTRGFISTDGNGSCVLARAGMCLSEEFPTEWEEASAWAGLYRTRTYGLTTHHRTRISLREQWFRDADLIDIDRTATLNLETDFKRHLIDLREIDDMISAGTAPWLNVEDFLEARNLFDEWRKSRRRVLRTKNDYEDFLSWAHTRPAHRRLKSRNRGPITPVARFLARAWAQRAFGCPGGHYRAVAALFTAQGFPLTANAFKQMAKRRQPVEECSPLSERDLPLIEGLVALGAPEEFTRCLNCPPHMHLRHREREHSSAGQREAGKTQGMTELTTGGVVSSGLPTMEPLETTSDDLVLDGAHRCYGNRLG